MSERKRFEAKYRDVLRLEYENFLPSRTIGFFVAIFVVLALFAISTPGNLIPFNSDVYMRNAPDWNGTSQVSRLTNMTMEAPNNAFSAALLNGLYGILFFGSSLIAFNVAQGFENGQYRTLLSYPISRRKLLATKIGYIFLIITFSANFGSLLVLFSYVPTGIDIIALLIMSIAMWTTVALVVSSCALLAIITRNLPITSMFGLGIWFALFIVGISPTTDPYIEIVRMIFFPLFITLGHYSSLLFFSFLPSTTVIDCLVSITLGSILSLVFFVTSIFLFERIEL